MQALASRLLRPCLRVNCARGRSRPVLTTTTTTTTARLLATLPNLPIFRALQSHDPHSLAVIHGRSERRFSYGSLVADVLRAKRDLESSAEGGKLAGERVAFLAENGYDYVGTVVLALAECGLNGALFLLFFSFFFPRSLY